MAFKSKDGKRNFGNRQQAKAYDERSEHKDSPEHEAKESPEFEAGEQEGAHEEPETETPLDEHMAEHGPAEKVEIHHDHEGGRHTKVSHHGGQKHISHHGSPEEAHMEGAKAAGVTGAYEPEGDAVQRPMGEAAIPGLSA